jgi:hypothetical protein
MEYLRRDARFCGVPYGEVDVDRLLQGLVLLADPVTGRVEVGVREKAVSALESLLFAKYQMFRNVYWHHGVRAATALYRRIVDEAVRVGLIAADDLVGPTDEELLYRIGERALDSDHALTRRIGERWIPDLRNRRLPKRACEVTAAEMDEVVLPSWVAHDTPARRSAEDALARRVGLPSGELMIDYPTKSRMLDLDLLILRRSGSVERLGEAGLRGLIDLPRVAAELYRTTRVLRVFTLERLEIEPDTLIEFFREHES